MNAEFDMKKHRMAESVRLKSETIPALERKLAKKLDEVNDIKAKIHRYKARVNAIEFELKEEVDIYTYLDGLKFPTDNRTNVKMPKSMR